MKTTVYFVSECGGVPTDPSMERVLLQVMKDDGLKKAKFRCRAGNELNDPEKLLLEINSAPKRQKWNIVFIRDEHVQLIDEPSILQQFKDMLSEMFGGESTIPPDSTTSQLLSNLLDK